MFTAIDDVSFNQDRVVFYFGFNSGQIEFAAKQKLKGEISHVKSNTYQEVIAWLGFTPLAFALIESDKFKKKYNVNLKKINEHLFSGEINKNAVFFFKQSDLWFWSETMSDLYPIFGTEIETEIKESCGKSFIIEYYEQLKEKKIQTLQKNQYEDLKVKLSKPKEKIET